MMVKITRTEKWVFQLSTLKALSVYDITFTIPQKVWPLHGCRRKVPIRRATTAFSWLLKANTAVNTLDEFTTDTTSTTATSRRSLYSQSSRRRTALQTR